jgi:hypothetical protein
MTNKREGNVGMMEYWKSETGNLKLGLPSLSEDGCRLLLSPNIPPFPYSNIPVKL